jgi:hypothetical protein
VFGYNDNTEASLFLSKGAAPMEFWVAVVMQDINSVLSALFSHLKEIRIMILCLYMKSVVWGLFSFFF